ncbi:MAG: hypothetical protein ACE5H8_11140 [Alphaproteobacteria bacterium]
MNDADQTRMLVDIDRPFAIFGRHFFVSLHFGRRSRPQAPRQSQSQGWGNRLVVALLPLILFGFGYGMIEMFTYSIDRDIAYCVHEVVRQAAIETPPKI